MHFQFKLYTMIKQFKELIEIIILGLCIEFTLCKNRTRSLIKERCI